MSLERLKDDKLITYVTHFSKDLSHKFLDKRLPYKAIEV